MKSLLYGSYANYGQGLNCPVETKGTGMRERGRGNPVVSREGHFMELKEDSYGWKSDNQRKAGQNIQAL